MGKLRYTSAKRDAPNKGAGNSRDFTGTNQGYAGATHDRNRAFLNRERAAKAGGQVKGTSSGYARSDHMKWR